MFRSCLFPTFPMQLCFFLESPYDCNCLLEKKKKAGENGPVLQADLKDAPFWLLLVVEGDMFESEGAGYSLAICMVPHEVLCKIFTFGVVKVLVLFRNPEHHPPGISRQKSCPAVPCPRPYLTSLSAPSVVTPLLAWCLRRCAQL